MYFTTTTAVSVQLEFNFSQTPAPPVHKEPDKTVSADVKSTLVHGTWTLDEWHSTNTLEGEQWKPVVQYEGLYEVSTLGRIKGVRFARKAILRQGTHPDGYKQVSLTDRNKNARTYLIHRLVASAFLPNPDKLRVVHHKDHVKDNNRLDNLEWTTQKQNLIYAAQVGAKACQKVTPEIVRQIRQYKKGGLKPKQIASIVNLSSSHVKNIIEGRRWAHVA